MTRDIRIIGKTADLVRAAASEFVHAAKEAAAKRGVFRVALSGGSTPKGMFALLATDPEFRDQVPWSACRFFWGDERNVPPHDADSNYRMANEAMLSRVPVDSAQVHRMRGEMDAAEAAAAYQEVLRGEFGVSGSEMPRFDLILLGMGPDGHCASLFPGTRALHDQDRLVTSNWVGKFYTHRITLTLPVLTHAEQVMFLIQGEDKAPCLKAVLEGPFEPEQLPSQLIQPVDGAVLWLVDGAAGKMLKR